MSFDFSSDKEPLKTFSLAGMTDIVLLLLIFFLLTSNFVPQFGIKVNLPESESAAPAQSEYVNVAITGDGTFYVNQEQVTRAELMPALREAQSSGSSRALVLRADQQARVSEFAAVASTAQALNLRVLMATEREAVQP
ncbi:MAG: biopolymer transporter ExbD [Bacteroidetes bacterium QS_1_65_9]|jgi:biopolymer transport protein ExbD|nr:MAG: biopolymer transporter ExbD [Bacteroidetes bacterium QS_1_65_9]